MSSSLSAADFEHCGSSKCSAMICGLNKQLEDALVCVFVCVCASIVCEPHTHTPHLRKCTTHTHKRTHTLSLTHTHRPSTRKCTTHTHTHTHTQSELSQEHNDAATAAAEFAQVELQEYKETIEKLNEEAAQVQIFEISIRR